ncbi:MAG: hypothetical protein EDM05_56115 [Leptolyngbya sp. IPPAS B-1204]|nr:hypothetical protein [Elainella sp. C42_A2020_010]
MDKTSVEINSLFTQLPPLTPHPSPPTARLIFLAPWGQCARVEAPHPYTHFT